jgi:hypothetical protein
VTDASISALGHWIASDVQQEALIYYPRADAHLAIVPKCVTQPVVARGAVRKITEKTISIVRITSTFICTLVRLNACDIPDDAHIWWAVAMISTYVAFRSVVLAFGLVYLLIATIHFSDSPRYQTGLHCCTHTLVWKKSSKLWSTIACIPVAAILHAVMGSIVEAYVFRHEARGRTSPLSEIFDALGAQVGDELAIAQHLHSESANLNHSICCPIAVAAKLVTGVEHISSPRRATCFGEAPMTVS